MNLLFLVNHELFDNSGITNKIICQFNSLSQNFEKSYLSNIKKDCKGNVSRVVSGEQVSTFYYQNKLLSKIEVNNRFKELALFCLSKAITHIYIRYTHFGSFGFQCFLKELNKNDIKVVLEVPTYPYDEEYDIQFDLKGVYHYICMSNERIFRRNFHKFIDKIITFSAHDEIFECNTIRISNAVNTNLTPIKSKLNQTTREIHFIGVAVLAFWHGYDRFIKSLSKYYRTEQDVTIFFHIVGDGPALNELRELADKLLVSKYVKFYGSLTGKALDVVFSYADVGVDSLARHRSGNQENNSLKSKEYIMRGLPLVKSHKDRTIDEYEFVYTVINDESDFDLQKITSYFIKEKFGSDLIRNIGLAKFSWEVQMNSVFKEIS